MISILTKYKNRQTHKINQVYSLLNCFYKSFFTDMYNELNIKRYLPIRDNIGLVMRKFESHDHPLEYTSKLVMYIQAQVAFNHLPLTADQQVLMTKLSEETKDISLKYVYTGPLNDAQQFRSIK